MVITNERQYRIAKAEAQRFELAIVGALHTDPTSKVDPRLHSAMTEALKSELAILRERVNHYEARKAGKTKAQERQ